MRNTLTLLTCFLALTFLSNINLKAADADSVSAFFIGSHGYMLESPDKKVALDALIYWEGNNYGYICPPYALNQKMETAVSPFDSIDLILISHGHSDHYNPETVESSMLKNQHAVLIATPGVRDDIEANVDSFSYYSDRIWAPQIDYYHSKDTVISDIPITITCIPHGNPTIDLFIYSFVLNNIRFLQINSWNSLTPEDYDTLGFNDERADVAFLCYDYIMNAEKLNNFKNHIHPVFSTISHVDGATSSRIAQIEDVIAQEKEDYPMDMLSIPMEQLRYIKTGDTILVDTLNRAPVINQDISNREAEVNVPFSFILPSDIATDPEGGALTYTMKEYTGSELPGWLSFNEETLELSGTPEEEGNVILKLTVADPYLAMRSETFYLQVTGPSSLAENHSGKMKIYPVPASDKLCIEIPSSFGQIQQINLFNMDGKLVCDQNKMKDNTIDVSGIPRGLYMLKYLTDKKTGSKLVIVQ